MFSSEEELMQTLVIQNREKDKSVHFNVLLFAMRKLISRFLEEERVIRANKGFNLKTGKFRLHIRKKFLPVRV